MADITCSLRWKNEPLQTKKIEEHVLDDMGLTELLQAVFPEEESFSYAKQQFLEMTEDIETLNFRQDIFRDLFTQPDFLAAMTEAMEKLCAYENLKTSRIVIDKKSSLMELVEKLRELQMYIDVILTLQSCFEKASIQAEGFLRIQKLVDKICKEKGFEELQADIHEISEEVSTYKSVTVGFNLDSMLQVNEVVFLSANDYTHKRNVPMLTRFGHFLQEAVATNSGLEEGVVFMARKNGQDNLDPIMKNLQQLMTREMDGLTKELWRVLKNYVDVSGAALTRVIPELKFYIGFANFFCSVKKSGHPVCLPEFVKKETPFFNLKEAYNIRLFLKNEAAGNQEKIICNDMKLDEAGNIFILTGPNSGGKTTYTEAIGAAVLLTQQGLAVPANACQMQPFDCLYTHFPADEADTVYYGRLGEEAKRISAIMHSATERSLFLLNETYSSTSFSEGLYLAKDLLRALKFRNISAIYNTHLHELAQAIPELNEAEGVGFIDSLVMGMGENGKRSYKVYRKKPDGKSYAMDIAQKYGVTYEQLINKG
ncbi:MAG: hypothetical protein ACI4HI_17715 [Lachnospiraceae bacterium]